MATPIYEAHDCPLCNSRPRSVCADCQKPIPSEATDYAYKHMGGCGFDSHTFDHRHTKSVLGVLGFSFAKRELCRECYRLDFAKAYPGETCRV